MPLALHASVEPDTSTLFSGGWDAYKAGDYDRALAIWTPLAETGHVNAQVNLGFMYDYGNGVKRDYRLAANWYRAAAIQGSAAGQYNLSLLIADGKVKPLAGRSSRYWLEKAAAQGFEDALRTLGPDNTTDEAMPNRTDSARVGFEPTKAYAVEIEVSTGTAWRIAPGYAVTNHHIIEDKQKVTLLNSRGDELIASVIASDATHDIAFLRVTNPERLPPALPLSSQKPSLGASVFTIGFPRISVMGKSPKLSRGIISSVNGLRDDPFSYQISVPIQQGNSGGPLLNMHGEVVGLITKMLGEVGRAGGPAQPIPNINYALKANVIRRFLDRIPHTSTDIHELRPAAGDLENLAARIQNSVLIVMAE